MAKPKVRNPDEEPRDPAIQQAFDKVKEKADWVFKADPKKPYPPEESGK